MSNLDNIIQQIMEEGRKEADSIVDEAKEYKEKTMKNWIEDGERKRAEILDQAKKEAEKLKDKAVSNANLQSRDSILKAKQTVVDRVIQLAKEGLKNLDDESYIKVIKEGLENLSLKENAVLLVPENRKEIVVKSELGYPVESGNLESGFAIREGHTIINNDFSSLVDYMRDELEVDIVKKLFTK